MKLRHNVLLLLAIGLALLIVAMPVSAQLNEIDEGDTVFIGEDGLDITAAVDAYTQIAWWAPGVDRSTSEPNAIETISLADNFHISSAKFSGKTGNWYRYDGNEAGLAFIVKDPLATLKIYDMSYPAPLDVTNGNTWISEALIDFKIDSDLYLVQQRDTGEDFPFTIVLKDENGIQYSILDTRIETQESLSDLALDTTPWYWSSGDGNYDVDYSWNASKLDEVGNFKYEPGLYTVQLQLKMKDLYDQYSFNYSSDSYTVLLEEEQPTLTVDPASLIRGESFYTTLTGFPDTEYIIWIKDCASCPNGCCSDQMTGVCCDMAPWIVMNASAEDSIILPDESGFRWQCPPSEFCPCSQYSDPPCFGIDCKWCHCQPGGGEGQGESQYDIGDTLIQWCGCLCTKTLEGIMPKEVVDRHYSYALVKTDENGEIVIKWNTDTCTKPSSYKIHAQRWVEDDVCEIDLDRPYAETCVDVQQGEVTIITEVCDEITDTSYLGETVHIYGTNTDSKYTYLFIKGPCQSCAGENMEVTDEVDPDHPDTFTKVPVKSDGTWEYYWYTRNLQIDLGQYTIYATSMPDDAPSLEGVPCTECDDAGVSCAAWAKASFTFLEPTLIADVNPKIIQIVCCSPPSIKVDGVAMGLRGEAIGQEYNTVPIGIWVFGENKVAGQKYIFEPVEVDCVTGEFSVDLADYMDTLALVPGTYTVVVQHPMYNHRLDIIPEERICDQSEWCPWLRLDPVVLIDEVWYPDTNRKFVATATPVRWSKLFVIDGPDRLAGTAALNALLAGFEDPNIDDQIKVLTFKVESNNALQAGFSGTPTSGGAPLSVFFTDISIGYPETWHWDFGDGYTSDQQNPTHIYENVGTYDVTLSVTGLSGSSSITKNDYVTVTTGPTQTGTVTTTPTTPTPSTMNLYSGWNFISTPRALADGHNTASSVFTGVNTGGHSIFTYDAGSTSWQALTANSTVKPLDGIWIYSTAPVSVSLTYKNDPLATPPTKAVYTGWNSIGFSDVNPAAARDTLQSVQSQWTQLIGYNGASQYYDTSIIKEGSGSHSDTNPMNPFKGYWLFMNAPGTLAAISA
ncbi:MAG: DUF3821 domain-containing protein [Methanolinea sp.]|nr:DUF3821 domain-containing protein [Methanolinea sp.]